MIDELPHRSPRLRESRAARAFGGVRDRARVVRPSAIGLSAAQSWTVAAFVGGGLLLTVAGAWIFGSVYEVNAEALRDWLQARGPLAPLAYIALLVAAIVVSPIPSVPLNVAAGLAFGLVWGTIYTLIGIELGGVIAFLLARHLGRPAVVRYVPAASVEFVDRLADRLGWRGIFLVRLIPLFHFDWISYAAGLTQMRFLSFASASLAGIVVPVIGVVAVGDSLVSDPRRAALIVAALIVLALTPVAWATGSRRRARGRSVPAAVDEREPVLPGAHRD